MHFFTYFNFKMKTGVLKSILVHSVFFCDNGRGKENAGNETFFRNYNGYRAIHIRTGSSILPDGSL